MYVPTYCLNYDTYFINFFQNMYKINIFYSLTTYCLFKFIFVLYDQKTKLFYKIKHYPLNLNNTIFIGQSKLS